MTLSFSPQPARAAARTRGVGVTAVLGPTNTGKTHLAIERMLAHSSGMIGLPLRLLAREVYNKVVDRVGRRERRADHRRGEDQAAQSALLGVDRRGHAARPRRRLPRRRRNPARRRSRPRPRLHRPHAQCPRPRGDAGAGRGHHAADGGEAAARRPHRQPPAAVDAHLFRREEDHPPAAPLGDRRLLGGGSLRHRRVDPPPARRRRGGAGRAVPAHAQCAGRALPVRRCRLSGRHRRHRHGPQSRRRSRRLCLRPQVRRLSIPPPQPGRAWPRSRAAPAAPRAMERSARPGVAIRSGPSWCRRWKATASSRSGCCNGAIPISTFPRSGRCRPRSR